MAAAAKLTKGAQYQHVIVTFLLSLAAWPFQYLFNQLVLLLDPTIRPTVLGFGANFHLIITFWGLWKNFPDQDWLYSAVSYCAYASVAASMLVLERSGFISNFMSEYLKLGEPYIQSSWGQAVLTYDFILLYPIYLYLAFCIANRRDWRSLGLYWSSTLGTKKSVILLGYLTGSLNPTVCVLINFPFAILGAVVVIRVLRDNNRGYWSDTPKTPILPVLDWILTLGLTISTVALIFRAEAALEGTSKIAVSLLKHEPVLRFKDPAPYTVIEALICLFYVVPAQLICLFYMFWGSKPQLLWEVALLLAGTVFQAQFTHMTTALHWGTPQQFRTNPGNAVFWTTNLIIVLTPHLLLYRLSFHRHLSRSKVE